jgi:hypothetical protein
MFFFKMVPLDGFEPPTIPCYTWLFIMADLTSIATMPFITRPNSSRLARNEHAWVAPQNSRALI